MVNVIIEKNPMNQQFSHRGFYIKQEFYLNYVHVHESAIFLNQFKILLDEALSDYFACNYKLRKFRVVKITKCT